MKGRLTVSLPETEHEAIWSPNTRRIRFASRSAVVRVAVREFLERHLSEAAPRRRERERMRRLTVTLPDDDLELLRQMAGQPPHFPSLAGLLRRALAEHIARRDATDSQLELRLPARLINKKRTSRHEGKVRTYLAGPKLESGGGTSQRWKAMKGVVARHAKRKRRAGR